MTITTGDGWLRDAHGRRLLLRGVNFGGSAKMPHPPGGGASRRDGFFDYRGVSFVGRPVPLAEADAHFARLRAWGLTFLRFLVSWEAIEHDGPGQYDEAYLDYLCAVVERAAAHDLTVCIDPHQDAWSRWTGGDGAPAWTLEAVGIDLERLHPTGAAVLHAFYDEQPPPRMIWTTNYARFGAATMFTLFFGGNDFAPHTTVDGQPVQDFLQDHYFGAVRRLAERLAGLPGVVGYDTMNEPSHGFIGVPDLSRNANPLRIGPSPTPFQSMLLAAGYPQTVTRWRLLGLVPGGRETLNPAAHVLWKPGYDDVWKAHGVWTDAGGAPRLLRPDYFVRRDGRPVHFAEDYLKPFLVRFAREVRAVDRGAVIFLEPEVYSTEPPLRWDAEAVPNVVHAAHWYDAVTLVRQRYVPYANLDIRTRRPVFGAANVRKMYAEQLAHLKAIGRDALGGAPTLIGEFGVPFNLNGGAMYRSGDFTPAEQALSAYYDALDANLLGGTLWNYTPDNTNAHGDGWNGEDLSIFSRDQPEGRALDAVVRPYTRRTAGTPLAMRYDVGRRHFDFTFLPDLAVEAPTEVFVPGYAYPDGFTVSLSAGRYLPDETASDLLHVFAPPGHRAPIRLQITPRPA